MTQATRSETAAVVCAEPSHTDWLASELEREGLVVRTWHTAEAALQSLHEIRRPRLIVVDLRLPDIDGWRFCRLLRSPDYHELHQTPLLVLSDAFRGADTSELARDLGAEAFLELPCSADRFRETVERLLRGETRRPVTSVLIVEDDATQCMALRLQFQRLGFSARTAYTAAEAESLIEQEPPDLALLDYYLPDHNGDWLLAKLKERNAQAVVVMLTAHPSPELALELMRRGADGYVTKPFEFDYLYTVCEKAQRQRYLMRAEALLNERTRELREREVYYRSLIENTSDVIAIIDADGVFRYVSPSVKPLLGYEPEQLLGVGALSLVAEKDRRRVQTALRGVVARESEGPVEFEMQRADGGWRTVEVDARNRLDDPVIAGIPVTIHDVSERKEAEAARRRFLERLTSLHEVTNRLSAAASPEDLCREAVCLGREQLGFQRLGIWFPPGEEAPSVRFCRVDEYGNFRSDTPASETPPADSPLGRVLDREVEAAVARNAPLAIDPTGDGGTGAQAAVALKTETDILGCLVAEASPSHPPLTEQDHEVLRLFASTISHLYARMVAEQASVAKGELLSATLLSMGEAIFVADADQRLLIVNRAAEELMGWSPAECTTKTLDELSGPLGLSAEKLLSLPADGTFHELETEGTPHRVFEVRVTPLPEGSQAGRRVVLLREVTEDRQVREQLEQQGKLAAVGHLAAGIAHDFNNLLTSVMGFAELLQRRDDIPPSAKERLRTIQQQGERAAELIRQILDFSRRSTVQLRPLNLTSLLQETVEMLRRTIEERVRVVLEIAPVKYMVRADVTQFQQVLTNLAVNARDAMPHGGELRFRMTHRTFAPGAPRPFPSMPDGDYVLLLISDTGHGMPPEVTKHIFEPFFTTKGRGKGTGLGLAQVYGIVKQHHGYIDLESEVGKGTTFILYLPAIGGDEDLHDTAPPPVARGCRQTLLVVEDEAKVREVLVAMLAALNYRVLTAEDGFEALDLYQQHGEDIQLVLTDMTMPRMGGIELFRALRRVDPEAKVMVISGYPQGEETDRLLEEGLAGWIQKPPTLAVLADAVQAALGETETSGTASPL